ncbi:Concanavalin A-like lectin/glucanase [Candidatus Magnetomorum sp. HK-1]|nr:Concanavalin A-like lectin/glucanase [Candidatus Magnetomorum sp. HK-1]
MHLKGNNKVKQSSIFLSCLSVILLFLILLHSNPIDAAWTAGANVVEGNKTWSKQSNFDLGDYCKPYYWDINMPVKGDIRLFEISFHGGWDAGYSAFLSYNFGEGVDYTEGSPPQLITKADASAGGNAWLKAVGPGVAIDFWGAEPFEINILDYFGISNTLLDEIVEIPPVSASLPFLDDNQPLITVPLVDQGIYAEDYNNTTDMDIVKLFAKIPGMSDIATGKIGFASGFKGHMNFGLGRIRYYKNQDIHIGDQKNADKGVDVSKFQNSHLNVSKRDYIFEIHPSIDFGIAAHIDINVFGFAYKDYCSEFIPDPETSEDPALATISLSLNFDYLSITVQAEGNYYVPLLSETDIDIQPIQPEMITPETVPTYTGEPRKPDTLAPVTSIWKDSPNPEKIWPRIITIMTKDNTDKAPKIFYSINSEKPIARGNGKVHIYLNQASTITYYAVDASGNSSAEKTYSFSYPKVSIVDLNLPDGSHIFANQTYEKKWQLTNIGSTTISNVKIKRVSGRHQLQSIDVSISNNSINANQTSIISASFFVPNQVKAGRHIQKWILYTQSGEPIQVNNSSSAMFWLDLITKEPTIDTSLFIDVLRQSEYAPIVYDFGVQKNIINPPSQKNSYQFHPFSDTTRGQFVKMLINALDQSMQTTGTPFTDVPSHHELFSYIQTAKNLDWIHGYDNGKFEPDASITNEEIALILFRTGQLNVSNQTGSLYSDVPESTPTGYSAQEWEDIYQAISTLKNSTVIYSSDSNFGLKSFNHRVDALALLKRFLAASTKIIILPSLTLEILENFDNSNAINIKATGTFCSNCTASFFWKAIDGGTIVNQSHVNDHPNIIKWIPKVSSTNKTYRILCSLTDGEGHWARKEITIPLQSNDHSIGQRGFDLTNPKLSGVTISPKEINLGQAMIIRWYARDNQDSSNDLKIHGQYKTNTGWGLIQSSGSSDVFLENTGSLSWIPPESGNDIQIRLKAIDQSGNESEWIESEVFTVHFVDIQEIPKQPVLYDPGKELSASSITILWQKVIDSKYRLNADYYILEYASNESFTDATSFIHYDNSDPSQMYSYNSYTINGLDDDTRYYFRVKAVNNEGPSPFSITQDILVNISQPPNKAHSPSPAMDENNVSKQPVLSWEATDPDGDDLDYYIRYGLSEKVPYVIRSFGSDNKAGVNTFDFAEEFNEILPSGSKIFWRVDIMDAQGNKTEGDIWSFTTESTGCDLAIIKVTSPEQFTFAEASTFALTVKNMGTEQSKPNRIIANYIKNDKSTPFRTLKNTYIPELDPGESHILSLTVQFQDRIIEENGQIYDNILISGVSSIEFNLAYHHSNDTNEQNDAFILDLINENEGKPEVTYFELRDQGNYKQDTFFALQGSVIGIVMKACDNTLIDSTHIDYRLKSTDEWQLIKSFSDFKEQCINLQWKNEHGDLMGNTNSYDWQLPDDSPLTNDAQIRLRIVDDAGSECVFYSKRFSIISPHLDVVKKQIDRSVYKLGDIVRITIDVDCQNPITSMKMRLNSDGRIFYHPELFDSNGLTIPRTLSLPIPDNEMAASNNSYVMITVRDLYNNWLETNTQSFAIASDLSEDMISPEIKFDHLTMTFTQGEPIYMTWTMSDNKNDIQKVEIHKILNYDQKMLLYSYSEPITSYRFTIDEDIERLSIDITVYDGDQNAGFASLFLQQELDDPQVEDPFLSFSSEGFSISGNVLVSNDIIQLKWTDNAEKNETILYTIQLKALDQTEFRTVGTSTVNSFPLIYTETTSFIYQIQANYKNEKYCSQAIQVNPIQLKSPFIDQVDITTKPSVIIRFQTIDGVSQYLIRRQDPGQSLKDIATVSTGIFEDTQVELGLSYAYQVLSLSVTNKSLPVELKRVGVLTVNVASIWISNAKSHFLKDNQFDLFFEILPVNAFNHFRVNIGTSEDTIVEYTTTTLFNVSLENLLYNTSYIVKIDALDFNNNITISTEPYYFKTPVQTSKLPEAPENLECINITSQKIDLKWLNFSENTLGFKVERKKKIETTYQLIDIVDQPTYSDKTTTTKTTYHYRVRTFNETGESDVSNTLTITSMPDPPIVTSTKVTNNRQPVWKWETGGGGNNKFRYRLNNNDLSQEQAYNGIKAYTPLEALPDGVHTLYVQEENDSGLWSDSGYFSVNVDTVAPVASIFGLPENPTSITSTVLIAGGTDVSSYKYKLDQEDWSDEILIDEGIYLEALQSGEHLISVVGKDEAGNWQKVDSATTETWVIEREEDSLSDGLVAYYPFDGNADDKSGNGNHGTVNGNAISTLDRFGRENSAYSFDGNDDFINIPSTSSLRPDYVTVCAWIKTDSTKIANIVSNYYQASISGVGFELLLNNPLTGNGQDWADNGEGGISSNLISNIYGNLFISTGFIVNNGKWHYVASSWDGKYSRLFIDGVEIMAIDPMTLDAPYTENHYGPLSWLSQYNDIYYKNIYIGKGYTYSTESFEGIIDDVRIYNRALSEKEIKSLYEITPITILITPDSIELTSASGTVHLAVTSSLKWTATTTDSWLTIENLNDSIILNHEANSGDTRIGQIIITLDGASNSPQIVEVTQKSGTSNLEKGLVAYYPFDGNANDESNNSNNGVVNEALLTTDRFGNTNSAYEFDGQNDYINCANSTDFNFEKSCSFSVWIKAFTPGELSAIINKWTISAEDKFLFFSDQSILFYLYRLVPNDRLTSKQIPLNEWIHIAAVYNDSKMQIFINGILDTQISTTVYLSNSSGNMYIGYNPERQNENKTGFNGLIDDVRIYNRALSELEIKSFYEVSYLSVSPNKQDISSDSGSLTFTVNSNINWTLEENEDWLNISKNNNIVTVNYEANPGVIRAGVVHIIAENDSYTPQTFEVKQEAVVIDLENGLVAYYPFNGNASDESGYGNHATVNGATLSEDRFGEESRAYSFDGLDDHITLHESHQRNVQESYAAWIRLGRTNISSTSMYFFNMGFDGEAGSFRFSVHSNSQLFDNDNVRFKVHLRGANAENRLLVDESQLTTDWIFYVYTKDGDKHKLFRNGLLIDNLEFDQPNFNAQLDLGVHSPRQFDYPYWADGYIDDVRIYNRVLSEAEINVLYTQNPNNIPISYNQKITTDQNTPIELTLVASDLNNDNLSYTIIEEPQNGKLAGTPPNLLYIPNEIFYGTDSIKFIANDGLADSNPATISIKINQTIFDINSGLVAYYPFNGSANDESGNGNHGTINGVLLTEDRFGKTEKAYSFNGNNNTIVLDDAPFDFAESNFSISIWVKWNVDPSKGSHILDKQGYPLNGSNGYRLMTGETGELRFELSAPDNHGVYNTKFIHSEDVWYHIAVKIDVDGNTSVFINGALKVSSKTKKIKGNSSKLTLGKRVDLDNTSLFIGVIDDTRFYNRALSEKEIQMLYKKCTDTLSIASIEDIEIKEDESITLPISITYCQTISEPLSITLTSNNSDLFSKYHVNESDNHFSLTIEPSANVHGQTTFTLLIKNSQGITDSTIFNVTIKPVDDPPVIALPIDDITANEDDQNTIIDLSKRFNDIDNDNKLITKTILTNTNESIVNTYLTDNMLTISYMPDQYGLSEIIIAATSNGKVVTDTFNILIKPVNDIPLAFNTTFSLDEDTMMDNKLQSSDIDNDVLKYQLIKTVENGSLNIIDSATGEFIYTPSQNFSGTDSFTFKVNDGIEDSLPAKVTLLVTAVDDPPVIVNSISDIEVNEDSHQQVISLSNVFHDIDNDNQLIIKTIKSNSNPTAVKAEIVDDHIILDFVPEQYGSSDISILAESSGLTTCEVFTVTIKAVNDPPSISDISEQFTDEDTPLSILIDVHDIDTPFDKLTLNAFSMNETIVANSKIKISSKDSNYLITITPSLNQNGSTFIKLSLNDGENTVNKTFILQIKEVNDPPEISDIPNQEMDEDTILQIPFIINDDDTPMHKLNVSITSSDPDMIKDEQIIVSGNNTNRSISITPVENASGKLKLTIQVNDGYETIQQTFDILIKEINDLPVVSNFPDTISTNEDTPVTIEFSIDDDQTEPSDLLIIATSNNTELLPNTNISITGSGSKHFMSLTFNEHVFGQAEISLQISDEIDITTKTLSLSVVEQNDPPTAFNLNFSTNEDNSFLAHLKGSDIDNDSITFKIVEKGNLGIVSITEMSSGKFNYSPYVNIHGIDSFIYKTNDGLVDSIPARVSITIHPINDPPCANAGTDQIVREGQNVVLDGTNSYDVDKDDLTYSWKQSSGISVKLLDSKMVQSSFIAPSVRSEGDTLMFNLLVSDAEQHISKDSVLIAVHNVFTKGDLNDDGHIDIEDIVLALQLIAGMNENKTYGQASIDRNQIGLSDVIYIFQQNVEK